MQNDPLLASIMGQWAKKGTAETVLPALLTDDLDLTNLPERLTEEQYQRVKAISRSDLPNLPPADEKHFMKCLRILLAVLPKRSADEISGELFVAAYQRKLGHYPNEAINFMADKAMGQCQWFPTIFECLEILSNWRRDDEAVHRRILAMKIASREREMRQQERWELEKLDRWDITQEQIDAMTDQAREFCVSVGQITKTEDGRFIPYALSIGSF